MAEETTPAATTPPVATLVETLGNAKAPLGQRMRAIFFLKGLGSHEAIDAMTAGTSSTGNSPVHCSLQPSTGIAYHPPLFL